METLLRFFSDLILFTAGLMVATLWIVVIVVILIETYDAFKEITAAKLYDDMDEEEY